MKKIRIIALSLFSVQSISYGQTCDPNLSDLIQLNNNVNQMVGEYPDAGGGGNWGVVIGDASYGSPPQASIDIRSNYSSKDQGNSAVFKRYHFCPNTNYKIQVGIRSFAHPSTSDIIGLRIFLGNNVQATTSLGVTGVLPSFPSRSIYNWSGSTFSDDEFVTMMFTTGPTESWDYLVINPTMPYSANPSGNFCDLFLGCLNIQNCGATSGEVYYDATLIPGGTTRGDDVYIGSSYASSSTPTRNTPNITTHISATQTITIVNNTILSGQNGYPTILDIDNCSGIFFDTYTRGEVITALDGGDCDGYSGKPSRNSTQPSIVTVSPNPTNNNVFSVTNPYNGSLFINLYDLSGRKIDSRIILANSEQQFTYPNLPKGIYLLKTNYVDNNMTFKIVFD